MDVIVTPRVQDETRVKLDPAKLLGFRNLVPVTGPGSDIKTSSELAFIKQGLETVA